VFCSCARPSSHILQVNNPIDEPLFYATGNSFVFVPDARRYLSRPVNWTSPIPPLSRSFVRYSHRFIWRARADRLNRTSFPTYCYAALHSKGRILFSFFRLHTAPSISHRVRISRIQISNLHWHLQICF